MTRLVQVDMTRTMYVSLTDDEAEAALNAAHYLDNCDKVTRWLRIANHAPEHFDAEFSIAKADAERQALFGYSKPVDGEDGIPSYLWSARHFVGEARHELSAGRYREGFCPELDEVNTLLGRLEERLRIMALCAYGKKTDEPATTEHAEAVKP